MRISFLLAFLTPLMVSAQEPLALITDARGGVTIAHVSGSREPAVWGTPLFEADTVLTGVDSEASILFSDGRVLEVPAASRVVISTLEPAADRSLGPSFLASISDLTLRRTGVGEIAALGGVRSGDASAEIALTAPVRTRVQSSTPRFSWEGRDGFDSYVVTVSTAARELWSTSTTSQAVEYPAAAPTLEPGVSYYWQVEGVATLTRARSTVGSFSVLSEAARDRIVAAERDLGRLFDDTLDDGTYVLALGALYVEEGLVQRAIGVFEELAATRGESPMLLELLGVLYHEIGQSDRAVAALRRALELSRSR